MADGSAMQVGTKMLFEPHHPYQGPGQWAEDPGGRSGPMCPPQFRKYAQALIPMMYSRIWIKGSVTNAGDPIIFSAITSDTALALFSQGAGGTSANTGLPAGAQANTLSTADTSVAQPRGRDIASLAPDNNMVFRWFGLVVSCQDVVTFVSQGGKTIKQYGTDWARPYSPTIQKAIMQEVVFSAKFGSTTEEQNFGSGILYNTSRLQQGDYNSNAGSPQYTMCEVLTGAPEDSDKMTMLAKLPFDINVGNQAANPTPAQSDIYVQLQVQCYGWLECREGGGVCPVPTNRDIQNVDNRMTRLEGMMGQLINTLQQPNIAAPSIPAGNRLGSGR